MMKIRYLCLIVGFATLASAQEIPGPGTSGSGEKPVLPPGPLLKPVPDGTRWTITTKGKPASDQESDKKAPVAMRIVGEKAGKDVHVLVQAANGYREEKWSNGNLQAIRSSGGRDLNFAPGSVSELGLDFPTWISAENFSEIRKQGEKEFLVFQKEILPGGGGMPRDIPPAAQSTTAGDQFRETFDMSTLTSGQREAIEQQQEEAQKIEAAAKKWMVKATAVIDAETRLPLAVQVGDITTTYEFQALQPTYQVIPPAVQAEFASRQQALEDSTRRMVRP